MAGRPGAAFCHRHSAGAVSGMIRTQTGQRRERMVRRKRSEAGATDSPVDIATGRLRAARRVDSPNCDARPPGVRTDLIVIHGISLPPGEFGGPWIDRL